MAAPVLALTDLKTHYFTRAGVIRAVDGVSLMLNRGEVLGLVGESGCGKTVTGLSILGLIDPPGRIVGGSIRLAGEELVGRSDDDLRRYRGVKMAMVFQDPMSTLTPVLRIDTQMIEAITAHERVSNAAARARARAGLAAVGIGAPEEWLKAYPHQLSGGMRQRVAIAIALLHRPPLLIADEPTTALDVTIQAQILELMKDLSRRLGAAMLIITHNLGVVARYADRVNVMYAGRIIERGTARELYANPRHPYTLGLLHSVPRLDEPRRERLAPIEGQPPDLTRLPPGCAFAPRCAFRIERCLAEAPPLRAIGANGHVAACWEAERVERRVA
ncbi:MAG TPA: ABC transporter ATP-binding protein [Methylomirabilota bacterium]|nr:ABC transporter ATP-binding protein [Methylomirabilota bacterium]